MISRLIGSILSKDGLDLEIDVSGVGYTVEVTERCMQQMPAINEAVTLFTHLVVREDAQLLYGFVSTQERALFRQLIKISGVGPKLAITILSHLDPMALVESVTSNNLLALTQVPGIGKKTAERLIIELRDKVKQSFKDAPVSFPEHIDNTTQTQKQAIEEAISALVTLGYKPAQASRMVGDAVANDSECTREDLIRLALQGVPV